MKPELEKILMKVQKPGRYTGGEWKELMESPGSFARRIQETGSVLYEED